MPLYEYRCASCDHRFEVLQRIGEDASGLECPRCGAERVEKQLSTFAAHGGAASGGATASAAGCGRPACGSGFT